MKRVVRYLGRVYLFPSTGALAVMSAVALVGSQIGQLDLFGSWYAMQPMFALIFAVIYGFSLNTVYRNVAMSMNCRRRDYFWGSQVIFLLTAAASTAITILTAVLPKLFRFGYAVLPPTADPGILEMTPLYSEPISWPVVFLVILLAQPVGAALGVLFGCSKALSTVFMVLFMILSVVAVVVLLFMTDGTIEVKPAVIAIISGVMLVIGVGCDLAFYRGNNKAVVRL